MLQKKRQNQLAREGIKLLILGTLIELGQILIEGGKSEMQKLKFLAICTCCAKCFTLEVLMQQSLLKLKFCEF